MLAFLASAPAAMAIQVPDEGRLPFKADPQIQATILAWADAETAADRDQSFQQLKTLAATSPEMLLPELLYFSSRGSDVKHAMAAGAILDRLGLPDNTTVEAVAPLLESNDEKLQESARNILAGFESRAAGRAPDFSLYREIIAERLKARLDPPTGLIRYMYQSDPGEALCVMIRANQLRQPDEIKPIIWGEHVVADTLWKHQYGFLSKQQVEPAAAAELVMLASHEHWWVRLYAAEIMRQHIAFRQPGLLEQLANDNHHLVKEAATAAVPGQ